MPRQDCTFDGTSPSRQGFCPSCVAAAPQGWSPLLEHLESDGQCHLCSTGQQVVRHLRRLSPETVDYQHLLFLLESIDALAVSLLSRPPSHGFLRQYALRPPQIGQEVQPAHWIWPGSESARAEPAPCQPQAPAEPGSEESEASSAVGAVGAVVAVGAAQHLPSAKASPSGNVSNGGIAISDDTGSGQASGSAGASAAVAASAFDTSAVPFCCEPQDPRRREYSERCTSSWIPPASHGGTSDDDDHSDQSEARGGWAPAPRWHHMYSSTGSESAGATQQSDPGDDWRGSQAAQWEWGSGGGVNRYGWWN